MEALCERVVLDQVFIDGKIDGNEWIQCKNIDRNMVIALGLVELVI